MLERIKQLEQVARVLEPSKEQRASLREPVLLVFDELEIGNQVFA